MELVFPDEALALVTPSIITLGLLASDRFIRLYVNHGFVDVVSRAIKDWLPSDCDTIWVATFEECDILAPYVDTNEIGIGIFKGEPLSFNDLRHELRRIVEELEQTPCPICGSPLGNESYVKLNCNHVYHQFCVHESICCFGIKVCLVCGEEASCFLDNCPYPPN